MKDDRTSIPYDVPDFVKEAEEMIARGEEIMPETKEVTIKFGKGLVGDPFVSKSGIELVEVRIPNKDKSDTRPWESFVMRANMVHDNKYGKGVWMKLPENGTTRISRAVKDGVGDDGKTMWKTEAREVSNVDLKKLMESYKEKTRGTER